MQPTSRLRWFLSQAFGSDEMVPYSAEYAWNSNQMAHTMMGFCLAICWLLAAIALRPHADASTSGSGSPVGLGGLLAVLRRVPLDVYVILLFATIPLKELADIWLDRGTYSGSPVSANTPRLLFDSITDISFWWTGMFLAAAIVGWFLEGRAYRGGLATVGLIGCIAFWYFYAAPLWLNQKRAFDLSGMPFNYRRLAVQGGRDEIPFAGSRPDAWQKLEQFRAEVVDAERPPQRHYVVFGGHPDDRSKLAVGMGCEYAFKIRPGDSKAQDKLDLLHIRYGSAVDLLELPELLEGIRIGPLECVIIDGLDVSTSRPSERPVAQQIEALRQAAEDENLPSVPVAARVYKEQILDRMAARPSRVGPAAVAAEKADQPQGVVEVSRAELEALAPGHAPSGLDAVDRRLAVIRRLGAVAGLHNISTIWVLGGYSGPQGSQARAAWESRKQLWIQEIADILGADPSTLQRIELTEPPTATRNLPPAAKTQETVR